MNNHFKLFKNTNLFYSKRKGGAKRLLDSDQEEAVRLFMQERCDSHLPLTTVVIQEFIVREFGVETKQPYISKLTNRFGFSSKLTQIRPAKRNCDCLREEIEQHREDTERKLII